VENSPVLNSPLIHNNSVEVAEYGRGMNSGRKPDFNPSNFSLTAEGGKNFFSYIKSFNLANEPDLLVLSPNSHYFYDENDLKNVRTIINLKRLNLIKDPDTFLKNLLFILPLNVNFIGCFCDSRSSDRTGFLTGLSSRFNNFLDSRTDHRLGRKEVARLLEKWGFSVVDMTEINGLTYFYSQKLHQPAEVSA